MKRSVLGTILAGVMAVSVTGCGGSTAKDSEWAKNVKVQVLAKADGGTDVMARALANKASVESGSTITIVNNTDGGGAVACEKATAGKRDGSILTQRHLTMLIKTAAGLYDKSAIEDSTVIGVAVSKDKTNNVLVVSGGSSYQTLSDLIGAVKERPGEVTSGVETGETVYIQTGLFIKAAGIDVKCVEAGSDTEKLTAPVGNSIDAYFVNVNQAKQYVESGKARALGAISNSDEGGYSSMFPEVPDFIEQGVDLSFKTPNMVLVGPEDMDSELALRIHDHCAFATNDAEAIKTLTLAGMEMEFLSLKGSGSILKEVQGQIDVVAGELGLRK